ncbi:MAG: hypothetical protein EOP62_03500 [Sphingomonadales bacterium]|nr:MAG: hypothetical protein EOP62_03500 [Sphingomonadales bacterium]
MRVSMILRLLAVAGCAMAMTPAAQAQGLFGDALTGKKLAAAIKKADAEPLGSEKNPVRVSMPAGQRAYLSRLRCANGSRPAFERGGSTGIGPFGNILDVYGVRCAGAEEVSIYMDMYHAEAETRAVPGFTIE